MTNYTITPINTGLTNTSKGQYLYHHSVYKFYDVEGFVKLPVTVFLVQGGGKKIMIDTGMSDTEIAGKHHHPGSMQPEGYAVYEQLENLGIKCSEMADIIFTHLHWDRVYHLDRFVNADLHVQRTEYQFAVNPTPLHYRSYGYPALRLKPQFDGRSFKLYDGEIEIFDGTSVYPTPGHSVGHQTVVINISEEQYHCCDDLIFTYGNLKLVPEMYYDIVLPGCFLGIADERNSTVELKKRVKSQEFVLPTHTPEMIEIVDSKRVYGS